MYFVISALITAIAVIVEYLSIHNPTVKWLLPGLTALAWFCLYRLNADAWVNENHDGGFREIARRVFDWRSLIAIFLGEVFILMPATVVSASHSLSVHWPGVITALIAVPIVCCASLVLSAYSTFDRV